MQPLIERNRNYRQNSTRLTNWLDRLAHFDISKRYTEGNILKFMEYLSGSPSEATSTEENYEEHYVILTLSELFTLNNQHGQLLNMQEKVLSTDQLRNLVLATN